MLKIKDNYELQQLTKYGFKTSGGDVWVYEIPIDSIGEMAILINSRDDKTNRYIKINYLYEECDETYIDILGDPTVLYRMIMDGIVEVIE